MNAAAITYPKGLYNPGGITQVFYAFPEDVLTFPVAGDPATAMTFAALIELSDDIVMKTGKQFFPLYCTLETGEVKSTLAGSRDGKGYENSVMVSFPSNDPTFLGFKSYGINRDFILLVKEKNGKIRVLGNLEDTAYIDADDEDSGVKVADSRKSTLTFKATDATSCKIYTGDMDSILIPAVEA